MPPRSTGGFGGTLGVLSLFDLTQMLSLNRATGRLDVLYVRTRWACSSGSVTDFGPVGRPKRCAGISTPRTSA